MIDSTRKPDELCFILLNKNIIHKTKKEKQKKKHTRHDSFGSSLILASVPKLVTDRAPRRAPRKLIGKRNANSQVSRVRSCGPAELEKTCTGKTEVFKSRGSERVCYFPGFFSALLWCGCPNGFIWLLSMVW